MYGCNGVDELTSWSVNGTQQRTWSQDALGNDLSSGTYSAANEETPSQGSSGYDAAGNMTTLQSGQTAGKAKGDILLFHDISSIFASNSRYFAKQ